MPNQETGATPFRPLTDIALAEVAKERIRQDKKWGEQNHDPFKYIVIALEELGEAAKEALELNWAEIHDLPQDRNPAHILRCLRKELVEAAASAVAAVECLDRGAWRWGNHVSQQGE